MKVHPDQVVITSGTSPALFMISCNILNRNEEIIISDPVPLLSQLRHLPRRQAGVRERAGGEAPV
ncbi:MAG: hypothetical protein MZV70_45830 [Desulfobacterales bacterium]|nr:hypothetical protein [Desulfobacterales bacterium]